MEMPRVWELACPADIVLTFREGYRTIEGRAPDYSNPEKDFRYMHSGDVIKMSPFESWRASVFFMLEQARYYHTVEDMLKTEGLEQLVPGIKTLEKAVDLYMDFPGYPERINRYGMFALAMGRQINLALFPGLESIFLVHPVRRAGDELKFLKAYVALAEYLGQKVYFPIRDTNQDDPTGSRILDTSSKAIRESDCVHVWLDLNKSSGSIGDIRVARDHKKPIYIINAGEIQATKGKSHTNTFLDWHNESMIRFRPKIY